MTLVVIAYDFGNIAGRLIAGKPFTDREEISWQTTGIKKRMPVNNRVVRADNSRRAAIRMKDNRLANATRARIKVSERANREIATVMKAVSKKVVATEAENSAAVRTPKH